MNTKMEKLITEKMELAYDEYCEHTENNTRRKPMSFADWLIETKGNL